MSHVCSTTTTQTQTDTHTNTHTTQILVLESENLLSHQLYTQTLQPTPPRTTLAKHSTCCTVFTQSNSCGVHQTACSKHHRVSCSSHVRRSARWSRHGLQEDGWAIGRGTFFVRPHATVGWKLWEHTEPISMIGRCSPHSRMQSSPCASTSLPVRDMFGPRTTVVGYDGDYQNR